MEQGTMYSWKPEEVFDLKGQELELLINYCNSILNNTEAQKIVAVHEIKKALDEKIKQGVDDGKISIVKSPN